MLFRSAVIGFFAILVSHPNLVGADPAPHNPIDNSQEMVVDVVRGEAADDTKDKDEGVDVAQDAVVEEARELSVSDTQELDTAVDDTQEMGVDAAQGAVVEETDELSVDDTQELKNVMDEYHAMVVNEASDLIVDDIQDLEDGVNGLIVNNTQGLLIDDSKGYVSSPLAPEYVINQDGSVLLRICYNWSCRYRQTMLFTAEDMEILKRNMATCLDTNIYDRLQRVRIGIWQMESLAQKYQPLLANDLAINDFEADADGRMDCVDNTSNTTTYLHILRDIGELKGWTVASTEVRNILDVTAVHWTAVIVDTESGIPWSVDSWFRPNGHLPMVMPLQSWLEEKKGWDPPFKYVNSVPQSVYELCTPQHR